MEISQEATMVIQDRGYEDISDEVREEGIKQKKKHLENKMDGMW